MFGIKGENYMITVKSTKWTPELVAKLHALCKQDDSAFQQIDCVVVEKMPVSVEREEACVQADPSGLLL